MLRTGEWDDEAIEEIFDWTDDEFDPVGWFFDYVFIPILLLALFLIVVLLAFLSLWGIAFVSKQMIELVPACQVF